MNSSVFHSFCALIRMMGFFFIPPPTVLKKNLQKLLSSSFSSKCCLIGLCFDFVPCVNLEMVYQSCIMFCEFSYLDVWLRQPLRKKATIHQVTTMLATSRNILFPGHNHLLTTGTDDPSLSHHGG